MFNNTIYFNRVTQLVIRKPEHFKYSPGDWVKIKIPEIAAFEWHPFTISSAPEQKGAFTLHIRGVGNWTNKLYNHYESIKLEEVEHKRKSTIRRTTVRRKEKNTGKKSSSVAIPIEDSSSPAKQKQLKVYIEGPFGAPASDIFRAEHAVLIATGIGVTPFSSILQSIMHQYKQVHKKEFMSGLF